MIVRLLAVLVALGLVAGTVQASALVTDTTAVATQTADVSLDETDDRVEIFVMVASVSLARFAHATTAVMTTTQLAGYQHCALVFRPPRCSAFV